MRYNELIISKFNEFKWREGNYKMEILDISLGHFLVCCHNWTCFEFPGNYLGCFLWDQSTPLEGLGGSLLVIISAAPEGMRSQPSSSIFSLPWLDRKQTSFLGSSGGGPAETALGSSRASTQEPFRTSCSYSPNQLNPVYILCRPWKIGALTDKFTSFPPTGT